MEQSDKQSCEKANNTKEPQYRIAKCVLCTETFKPGDPVTKLKCSHVFDEQCLGAWMTLYQNCPTCKRRLVIARDFVV